MKVFHTLVFLIGLALLIGLIYQVGPQNLWGQISTAGWGILPMAFLEVAAIFLHGLGWGSCFSPSRRPKGRILFRLYLVGFSLNFLTPTATIGGEIVKGMLVQQRGAGSESASSVLIDKLTDTIAELALTAVGAAIVMTHVTLNFGWEISLWIGTALIGIGLAGFFWVQRKGRIGLWAEKAARLAGSRAQAWVRRNARRMDEELRRFYATQRTDFLRSLVWHSAGYFLGIAQAWIFLRCFDPTATVFQALTLWVLGTWFDFLAFFIPSRLGAQEGSRMLVFGAMGLSAAAGLAWGLILRAIYIFWSLLGLSLYAVELHSPACTRRGRMIQGGE